MRNLLVVRDLRVTRSNFVVLGIVRYVPIGNVAGRARSTCAAAWDICARSAGFCGKVSVFTAGVNGLARLYAAF